MKSLKIIETEQITEAVAQLCVKANTYLNPDVLRALEAAREGETSDTAREVLDVIIDNAAAAAREHMPICQDTGIAVVFVSMGQEVHINGDIEAAINEGVRQGYRRGFSRNSIVPDPINRINTGDNTPAVIHYEFCPGDKLRIVLAPKGFGSENMSGLRMLNPSDGIKGVEDFVVETVRLAGANPCPPIIVGVGVGGTAEKAAILAKKSLLRELGESHPDTFWSETESRILSRINELNIGPAGFGGRTTALGVHILTYPTHIAGLPVAVNINCHVARHREVEI